MRSRLAFPITLVITAAVALLPAGWRFWTRDVAEIVRFPLEPFSRGGTKLAGWLRAPASPAEGVPAECRDLIEQLTEQRDVAQQLYQAEHRQVLRLEEQNRHLQNIPGETLRRASTIVTAYVTRRSPVSPLGVVEARLERGAPYAVPPATVAIYAGVHLVGRTVGESSRGVCTVLPVISPAVEVLRARVQPADRPETPIERQPVVHLEPTGTGAFRAEIDRSVIVEVGDVVRLDDDTPWPETAQMMVLGHIDSIDVNDREPLRNTIVVEPAYELRELPSFTLVIDAAEAAVSAEGGAP